MKFSESWLRTFVAPQLSGEALSHLLTMAGLEVEEEQTVAPAFNDVIVAQVLEVQKHPDADRLNVCRVDIGTGTPQQIVCGAPNVAAGLKVPCALPGASLPGDFTIKLAKVRGIESAGMLCSAKELGIAEDASGLLVLPADAPVGQCLREYLDLDDRLLTLKLTPNRADCLSLTGVAREVAALTGAPLKYVEVPQIPVSSHSVRDVVLDATTACPLYCGRVISGVDARISTPEWMKRRLERSGIRSLSVLVDITNYVMLELGQPLHAFDNTRLSGSVHVRMAKAGEQLLLLNEQTITLDSDVLVIADEEKALAMAGVMGGEESGITLETTELFLESAYFEPAAIAGRARRYGFVSDASHRFERGVDFGRTREAIERATQLILEICSGHACPLVEAKAQLPVRRSVELRVSRVTKILGLALDGEQIAKIFDRLAFSYERQENVFLVTPPSYRFDIEIEEDLIEEIARLYGYDNIPAPAPQGALSMLPQVESGRPLSRIRHMLTNAGYHEVINFAFVEEAWEADLSPDFGADHPPIRLANPIASQMSVMRSSLLGGLLANLMTNLKRKQNRVRLFEIGRCFLRDPLGAPVHGFRQPWRLGGLAYGTALPEQWGVTARTLDFFDVKGDLEALLTPAVASFEKVSHPALHPGRAAQIVLAGKVIGVLGELHPKWAQKYELPLSPVLFELDLEPLKSVALPTFSEVSRYPVVIRDLAFVVDQAIPLQTLLDGLLSQREALVQAIHLFDVYSGEGVVPGKKSVAFRIVMQDTQRTLQDAEVDAAMQHLIAYVQGAFSAHLRV